MKHRTNSLGSLRGLTSKKYNAEIINKIRPDSSEQVKIKSAEKPQKGPESVKQRFETRSLNSLESLKGLKTVNPVTNHPNQIHTPLRFQISGTNP